MSDDEQLKTVPLDAQHREAGARMVPFAGYSMPARYEGLKHEHHAVRSKAGLFDVSHMGRMEVRGGDAIEAIDRLVTNDVTRLSDGRAHYTVMCNEEGGIIDDLVVYRLTEERLLLCVNAANRERDRRHIEAYLDGDASLVDRSSATAQLALQGPKAEEVLSALTGEDLQELRFFRCVEAPVVGVPTLIARTGYTGEDGFELYLSAQRVAEVFETILGLDAPTVTPCGLGARDTLRLEAGLLLHGQDIDESIDPLSAGLSWLVKFDTKGEFMGRKALEAIRDQGPKRVLRGFVLEQRGVLRAGYDIEIDGQPVGQLTSGSFAPTLEASIGLGYIDHSHKEAAQADAVIRGRRRRVKLVDPPFYDRP